MADISRTTALKDFLDNIGSTVFFLNTICVGLDRVKKENITKYDEGLRVSWTSKEPVNDAQRARIFANKSSLAFCVSILDQYLKSLNVKPKIIKNESLIAKLDNSNPTGERITSLIDEYEPEFEYWGPSIRLAIAWRNRIIHSNAKVTLSKLDIDILKSNKKVIFHNHSGLDIEQTLDRYIRNEGPTLKDTSSLVSIIIKTVRFIDSKIIENHLTKTYVIELLLNYISEKKKNPISEIKTIWNLSPERRERKITNIYIHSGIISGKIVPELGIALVKEVSVIEISEIVKIAEKYYL